MSQKIIVELVATRSRSYNDRLVDDLLNAAEEWLMLYRIYCTQNLYVSPFSKIQPIILQTQHNPVRIVAP